MKSKDRQELNYFLQRRPQFFYLSKPFPKYRYRSVVKGDSRFIRKVVNQEKTTELYELEDELVLRDVYSRGGRFQIRAVVYSNKSTGLQQFTIQNFKIHDDGESPVPESYTGLSFTNNEFRVLLDFLRDIQFLDYSNRENHKIHEDSIIKNSFAFNLPNNDPDEIVQDKQLLEVISSLNPDERADLLANLKKSTTLTRDDLNVLTGRKEGFELFTNMMDNTDDYDEKKWQSFFEDNEWIFGFGLDYKFLNILQREASISNTDLNGKNQVDVDYLMENKNFTVLVELKTPTTNLFHTKRKDNQYRSQTWMLSNELTYAVSQILSQKAEWQFKSKQGKLFSSGKEIISETINPKTILIIGHSNQFQGQDQEDFIKRQTFELYRRNSRDIEILTYDELYDRANYIVNGKSTNNSLDIEPEDDNLPF